MKRFTLAFCILCCLVLSSCKGAEVQKIEEMIDSIGEVSLDSIDNIEKIERMVTEIKNDNPGQYKKIDNLEILEAARTQYDKLYREHMVESTKKAISIIGEVTLGKSQYIKNARSKYDELTEEEKKQIENYPALENAEKIVNDLKIESISNMIASLDEVTLGTESQIKNIQKIYDELTDQEKEQITNYDVLVSAQQKLSDLKIEKAVDLINEIGTITTNSNYDIWKAQTAWEALSDEEKKQAPIDGDSILMKARDDLTVLQNQHSDNTLESPIQEKGPTMGDTNAMLSAISYINTNIGFSRQGLIEQLEYEGYSNSEATYGADNCGADWYAQAVVSASNYISVMPFSRQGLIDQLESEGFTYDQAVYGVEEIGY